MFSVNIKNETYHVFFSYGKEKRRRREQRFTEATLLKGETKKEAEKITSVKEFCSVQDNFNRNVGRKKALAKLLNEVGFSVEERKLFWDEYFKARGFIDKPVFDKQTKLWLVKPVPNY